MFVCVWEGEGYVSNIQYLISFDITSAITSAGTIIQDFS